MESFKRFPENPVLSPANHHPWEAGAAFNPCVATDGSGTYHMVYRALSELLEHRGERFALSTVGYASGEDPLRFGERRQLIVPEHDWEAFGCEDPRITFFEGTYYIFYTALSVFPFSADGIKIGLATTKDFVKFEKHAVTPFNSKAMMLFPERVDGKLAAILTVNTDRPPAKIALALFEREEDIWSPDYWNRWYADLDQHIVPLLERTDDQVEAGGVPQRTDDGWLFFYSYITNYRSGWNKTFGVRAALLDAKDPRRVIGRTHEPLIVPQKEYELHGIAPNIVFPSGALIAQGNKALLYYGAADTTGAIAGMDLGELLAQLRPAPATVVHRLSEKNELIRFAGNPILTPRAELAWEAKAVFNPAALYEDGKVHLVYRAMSEDNTSVFGYASSRDGFHIDERLNTPIYVPRTPDEEKRIPNGNSGCEDPRLTKIGDRIYLYYTAYNGAEPPRVACSSIAVSDFLAQRWNAWEPSRAISPPSYDDKDACVLPKKIGDHYVVLHRLGKNICIDATPEPILPPGRWLEGMTLFGPRDDKWDNVKVGIASPPLETPEGWLMLYHGVSNPGNIYKLGAALLSKENPADVIARSETSLLASEMKYEREGQVPNIIFPCGAIVMNGTLFVYYGGADSVVGVATADLAELVASLKRI
jgi:predicted GH43/DUF377 family glycosyl hydrolase